MVGVYAPLPKESRSRQSIKENKNEAFPTLFVGSVGFCSIQAQWLAEDTADSCVTFLEHKLSLPQERRQEVKINLKNLLQ